MKSSFLTVFLLSIALTAFAQADLSLRTRIFLSRYDERQDRQPGYLYRTDGAGKTVMPALLQIGSGSANEDLERLGVRIGTRAGTVWTVAIPPSQLSRVAALSSIKYLELDEPVVPTMDSARRTTRVDSVHAGWGLPQRYSGMGVVVGILDVGFDYTHPTLWDTAGTRYRVRKVWEQRGTGGTPPPAFGYGRELSDSTLIQAAGSDNIGQSHGSHVAGIAIGSGRGAGDTTQRRYRGMAYGADVVLVGITPPASDWTSTGMTDIINGMKYVYDYAASVGKPAVVNLSWGCSIGSHDGRSLFSQACAALMGPGKLFVLSAGNNGVNAIHLQKTFTAVDTAVHSFVGFPATPAGRRSWLDIWGDSAQQFSVRLSLFNGSSRTDSSAWMPLSTALQQVVLYGLAGDSLMVSVAASPSTYNNKPRMLLDMESRTADQLCVSIRGTDGTVHSWLGFVHLSTGYYGSLGNGGFPWATPGNTTHVLGDMASTQNAVAVAAYASKNIYFNLAGGRQDYSGYVSRGRLVPFSSKGPTADGRIKPDLTGPGLWLSSSVNSFDTSFAAGGSSRVSVVTEWTQPAGRTYQYAALTGTSMSSPAVAGIAALLLEAAPALTPDSLRSLLAITAIKEAHMGTLPNSGWGAGKVNAYGALQRLLGSLGVSELVKNAADLDLLLYPNPSSGTITIEHRAERGGKAAIIVSDASGRTVLRDTWMLDAGANVRTLNRSALSPGLYLILLTTPQGSATMKMQLR